MPSLASCWIGRLVFCALASTATAAANDAWLNLLASVNLTPQLGAPVLLPSETASMEIEVLRQRIENGAYGLMEGGGTTARAFGFRASAHTVTVRGIVDVHNPKLPILWEQPLSLPVFEIPKEAIVFARARMEGAPLAAGLRIGKGAVLWLAADPGPTGRERFPYLTHALKSLGLEPPLATRRLWVFFDSSYRLRADPEYLARRWRRSGISAIHVAAWHYFELDAGRDKYLENLINACHRNAIHVYAWLELPHVSEAFWEAHPEWREKTASGAEAHLDWRKLMNLRHPECDAAVRSGVEALLRRFDWDGVNLAELYFESLEGHANPARFTPMNEQVRAEFTAAGGFDPAALFDPASAMHWSKNGAGLARFLEYRAGMARRMQEEWIARIEQLRGDLPHLDLVLTHVDNLLQPETRDRIGADAKSLLPLLDRHSFTFLIEDPATAWASGPSRYPEIAALYKPLVTRFSRLAIDINVVDRYQDVYPTKRQTGIELFEELRLAAGAFSRVALYFENSILQPDWPLIAGAAVAVKSLSRDQNRTRLHLPAAAGLRWDGAAKVDGRLWPFRSDGWLWLPAGEHVIEPAAENAPGEILDLNADLKSARISGSHLEFVYESAPRALGLFSRAPMKLFIDGEPAEPKIWLFPDRAVLVLPRGQHAVSVSFE
jgi:hypothetical protein